MLMDELMKLECFARLPKTVRRRINNFGSQIRSLKEQGELRGNLEYKYYGLDRYLFALEDAGLLTMEEQYAIYDVAVG